jgi:hypothetical protein
MKLEVFMLIYFSHTLYSPLGYDRLVFLEKNLLPFRETDYQYRPFFFGAEVKGRMVKADLYMRKVVMLDCTENRYIYVHLRSIRVESD